MLFKTPSIALFTFLFVSTVPHYTQASGGSGYGTIQCWNADIYDKDGDGYANSESGSTDRAGTDDREEFIVLEKDGSCPTAICGEGHRPPVGVLTWGFVDSGPARFVAFENKATCPEGWVRARGDCNDNRFVGADIHPRRGEVYGNGTDDNCNGLVDEPEFYYKPEGNDNKRHSFDMTFTVNDPDVAAAFADEDVDLKINIEYQKLSNTGKSTHVFSAPDSFMALGSWVSGKVKLTHLQAETVYRARIHFYASESQPGTLPAYEPIGYKSEWYYTVTKGSSALSKARAKILLQGFYQYYESAQHSLVGYRGAEDKDGTRYDASEGEAWCSEFYVWLAEHELNDFPKGDDIGTSAMADHFKANGKGTKKPSNWKIKNSMQHGDYVGEAGSGRFSDMHHTSMFLAYDKKDGKVWTLGGNTGGYNRLNDAISSTPPGQEGEDPFDTGTSTYKRLAGNEVFIQPISKERIVFWGKIKVRMLRD